MSQSDGLSDVKIKHSLDPQSVSGHRSPMDKRPSPEFLARLGQHANALERQLRTLLASAPQDGELLRPEPLMDAIRHGVLNGGKRIRPFLVLESASLFEADPPSVLRVAAALECIHCYSLIHDDLPAMDNDDLRRGQPTVHVKYDEASAILAGDALLTMAFDIIADDETELPPRTRLNLISGLSRAAGIGGMVGGQALDLSAANDAPDEEGIIILQAMKTGALIRFACEAGAIIGNASSADRERLSAFGSAIGLAFQLADDILDRISDAEAMGKATGKDEDAGKATLVDLHGVDWAQAQLSGLVDQAVELLEPYGERAAFLRDAAYFTAYREN